MIREVSETLVDVITQATPDLGDWVDMSSLSAADGDPVTRRLALALYAVEEHPHLVNGATGQPPQPVTPPRSATATSASMSAAPWLSSRSLWSIPSTGTSRTNAPAPRAASATRRL